MKVKDECAKAGLKLNIQKTTSCHLVPSRHGKQIGEKRKQQQISFSWAPKSLQTVTAARKFFKRHLFLGRKGTTNLVASVVAQGVKHLPAT